MELTYQKAFSFIKEDKKMPNADNIDTPKAVITKEPIEQEHRQGPDFSYFMNNKVPLPVVGSSEEPKKRGRKKTDPTAVITDKDGDGANSNREEPYAKTYEETTNLLKGTIVQLDHGLAEMQQDVNTIRASKTMKSKYTNLANIQATMGQYIGTKVTALREINSTISKCNELELKRMQQLHAQENDQNTDKAVMDMYSAFISMPTDMNPGIALGPTVNQLTYNPTITGAVAQSIGQVDENAGYDNFLNNMSPAQRLSLYESDPNVQQVVVYDNRTNTKRFEVMNVATGEIIPNVDKRDMMFMDDTVLDLDNHIARNINLNETYPIVEVGTRLSDAY